ncbi:metal ABC transporter solute-binding protein, Zn/Mn family [uncultured Selenomonas sp.]|uniref:metal ABC transporter solute-binding protein, Zn/Mn family n=1 Tax=uncultured Selenomonas sp. TaxID=159275 RepID=UPI0028DCB391|nr:zinc ABC transporter substrate-binding protein [uncultured Selenomonas sp.]
MDFLQRMLRKNGKGLFLLALCLVAALLAAGCGGASGGSPQGAKKKVTVTTSFLADMTKELAGDYVDIDLIIPAGEDPHLYVAQPADLKKLKDADLVLYHGLHFEGKMVEVLEKRGTAVTADFPTDAVLRMEEDGESVVDPHFWFSIALYKKATEKAAESLVKLVPEHEKEIRANTAAYLAKLDALDAEVKEKIASIPAERRNLVTPHDAFNYFSKSYGVTVVAPQGVSTNSEVANADIEKTAEFIKEHKVKAVFAESTTNPERMKKLQEICKSKGFDVEIVGGEGNELFSDSLAPAGQKGDTFIDMYRFDVDLIVSHLK